MNQPGRPAPDPAVAAVTSRSGGIVRLVVIVGITALLLVLGRRLAGSLPQLTAQVESLGAWAPAVFVAVYAAACVAFVPASILTFAAGALFGVVQGTLLVLTGATLGAFLAFLVARYIARDWVAARVQRDPRFAAIDRAVADDGRRIVFLLRLSPLVPFNLLNYALGLTQVRAVDYLVASLGMIPGTLLYVYTGSVAGTVLGATGGAAPARGAGFWLVLGLGLAATAAVAVLVGRMAKRALASATASSGS
ncbi:MAG: TVP38/TMEM64 family protein [Gemmatimonadaceae bacterium]|nr:TVP38/TMEM64 family protein [Gemmatimonadaceae bacterium]